MALLYKVNVQTRLNGALFGVGRYDAERIGNAATDIEQYVNEQKALPFEQRDIPPIFEIIDTDRSADTVEQKLEQKVDEYVGMNKNELLDLAKQRGLDVKKNMSAKTIIEMLSNEDEKVVTDENNVTNQYNFKDADDFNALDDDAKIEYLDEIFSIPDGVNTPEEEEAYIKALGEVVQIYSGLSLNDEAIEKVKEILDYCNS